MQGAADDPFASPRSAPYPMPPGVPMYLGLLLADAAERTAFAGGSLHPHRYPAAINSQPYAGRPACVDCGFCAGFGCPSHAKGSPAVTALRRAFQTGRCQLRYNCQVLRLENDGGHVSAALYEDGDGAEQSAVADRFLLAASAIESARLCLLSQTPAGGALGDGSGLVGRNLIFHHQTLVNGFLPQRVHGQRGRAVSHGLSDFRGVLPGGAALRVFDTDAGKRLYLGGIVEFGAPQGLPITEDGMVFAFQLPSGGARFGSRLKNALRDGALSQHLIALIMQAEDAPQPDKSRGPRPGRARRVRPPGGAGHLPPPRLRARDAPLLRAGDASDPRERRLPPRLHRPPARPCSATRPARATCWARCAWAPTR